MSPSASLKPFAQRLNGRSSEEFCEDVWAVWAVWGTSVMLKCPIDIVELAVENSDFLHIYVNVYQRVITMVITIMNWFNM